MSSNTRVAILGFGRTGRQAFKAIWEYHSDELELAAIGVKDPEDAAATAHLLKYDSNYGRFPPAVEVTDGKLRVGDKELPIVVGVTPDDAPWKELGIDIAIDASGAYVSGGLSAGHLKSGARKVVITAPSEDADFTLIYGLNDGEYDPEGHDIISTGSDTSNALAVVACALSESFDVESALTTSVRAYTSTQKLIDRADTDLRRARSAPQSIVPTRTGAAEAAAVVCPRIRGRLGAYAVRVPVSTVSILELTAHLSEPVSADEVNDAFRRAADGPLSRVLGVANEPLVSRDYRGCRYSAVVDAPSTITIGSLVKVSAWYDNEWGYSCRVADAAALLATR